MFKEIKMLNIFANYINLPLLHYYHITIIFFAFINSITEPIRKTISI